MQIAVHLLIFRAAGSCAPFILGYIIDSLNHDLVQTILVAGGSEKWFTTCQNDIPSLVLLLLSMKYQVPYNYRTTLRL